MLIRRVEFLPLAFVISLDYHFQFYAACNLKYEQNLAFYFNYMETILLAEENFYPWIDIVWWGIMNELFNQELSILQISE